jgi:D-isomer specific 2-hydroxyacid dehydrogenase, NAD binding domain
MGMARKNIKKLSYQLTSLFENLAVNSSLLQFYPINDQLDIRFAERIIFQFILSLGFDVSPNQSHEKNHHLFNTVARVTCEGTRGANFEPLVLPRLRQLQMMALLLALARNLVAVHLATKQGGWKSPFGMELRDKLIGIVGLGRIGKGVALRAKGFGMKLAAYDPYPEKAFAAEHEITLMELDDLLQVADVVTLHAAAEQVDGALIHADRLQRMNPTAFLINTARGSLVDETALATALKEKRIAGAGLDAFINESPTSSPLLELDNVVLTPHMAGRTLDGVRRMGEITVENCLRGLRREAPLYPVV